jgi:hypothetical protein
MKDSKVIEIRGPEGTQDALTELSRTGAQRLIKEAVEDELSRFLETYENST